MPAAMNWPLVLCVHVCCHGFYASDFVFFPAGPQPVHKRMEISEVGLL